MYYNATTLQYTRRGVRMNVALVGDGSAWRKKERIGSGSATFFVDFSKAFDKSVQNDKVIGHNG